MSVRQVLLFLSAVAVLECAVSGQSSGERFSLFSGVSFQEQAIHGGNAALSFQIAEPFSLIADFSVHRQAESGVFSPDIVYGLLGGQVGLGIGSG